jgi:glyoxylase-like metal-dependent hydrolase (beta-lactamase superfamily II)
MYKILEVMNMSTPSLIKAAANLKGMTAQQVTQIILSKEPLFILDVRNEGDFNDWKIEGERITAINIPYFELLDGVEGALEKIPADEKVLVVCAKEGSSIFVAEQLIEAGKSDVFYLEGGMNSWSEYLEPVKVGELKDGGTLYQFVRIGKGCLSYMVLSNGEAAIVDTLRMTDVFESFAKNRGVQIKHTMDTHLHADHISGGRKLAEQVGATYWLPPKDAEEVVFDYEKLEDGEEITVGDTKIKIQALYSPGHTIGSTSFIVDDQYLLTGDILFIESIGRPDLAGQAEDWVGDLRNTLYSRYRELSKDLIVLPAHFGKITELGESGKVSARLGDLYEKNPGLNIPDEAEFRRAVTDNLPQHPNSYQEIRQTNMGKIEPENEQQRDMEIGPNRCAIHDK